MFKMKSALCIVAIFSLALVSCVERIPEKELPNVNNGAITMVKATVKPLVIEGLAGIGAYKWDGIRTLGIYGTSGGVNECYLPVKSTAGSEMSHFYGNVVAGDLTIYSPHSVEGGQRALDGRVVVPSVQNYYADPFDHFMYNSTFLGQTSTDTVEFDYHAGLVKILIKYDVEEIVSVRVLVGNLHSGYSEYIAGEISVVDGLVDENYSPSSSILIENFGGKGSTTENPLEVWLAAAPGIYENFVIEITDKNDVTIASPVKGPFEVSRCTLTTNECVAEKIDHNNSTDEYEGEEGRYN